MKINNSKLKKLFKERNLKHGLNLEWAEFMEDSWKAHIRKYKDVPKSISEVFSDINDWLITIF